MKKFLGVVVSVILLCMLFAGCGQAASVEEEQASDASVSSSAVVDEGSAETEDSGSAAEEAAMSQASDPVYADALDDGTYTITVESSSSMFKVVDAQLTVSGSEMTAVLTLSGTGYEKLYMGTGEEALNDSDDKCIYFAPDAEGSYTYEVPVTALNEDIDVAAWSIRKQEWYDRILVFESASLPDEAFAA